MNSWLLRGLGMASVHVGTRVVLGLAVTQWPLHGSALRWLSLALVVIVALVWGGLDGIRDARSAVDEESGADLTMMWLKAAAVAGLLAGAVCWLLGVITDIALGDNTLFFELTSGAAFTVLLVFLPAMLAVAVGRFLVRRKSPATPAHVSPAAAGAAAVGGYASEQDYDVVEAAEENYESSEWAYEHGTDAEGTGYDDATQVFQRPAHDDAPTEVFEAIRPENGK
ncbi:B-4DMT family transporter [Rhodococcus sp. NPDC058514]|uniref:B-4DMT family transporter n=1 Tax=unclassified Rhodococcus (in: high G+C Gram-positive bacteria) TaxID=192944 RepID=UPI003650355A